MAEQRNGWIAAQGHIIGDVETWEKIYTWSGKVEPSRALAISRGFGEFRSDDFNVGQVEDGKLVWWGWMDDPLLEDLVSVAAALGLAVSDG